MNRSEVINRGIELADHEKRILEYNLGRGVNILQKPSQDFLGSVAPSLGTRIRIDGKYTATVGEVSRDREIVTLVIDI